MGEWFDCGDVETVLGIGVSVVWTGGDEMEKIRFMGRREKLGKVTLRRDGIDSVDCERAA